MSKQNQSDLVKMEINGHPYYIKSKNGVPHLYDIDTNDEVGYWSSKKGGYVVYSVYNRIMKQKYSDNGDSVEKKNILSSCDSVFNSEKNKGSSSSESDSSEQESDSQSSSSEQESEKMTKNTNTTTTPTHTMLFIFLILFVYLTLQKEFQSIYFDFIFLILINILNILNVFETNQDKVQPKKYSPL